MCGADDLFESHEAVTPPLNEQDLKAVPAKRGVFALLAADGTAILVTTAADIRSRLRYRLTAPDEDERRKTADLREITAKVCWTLTYSRFETDWRYLETVRRLWPDTYEDLLPKRQAWFVACEQAGGVPAFCVVAGAGGGRQFGPFADRRSAERFIDAIVDAFDLCRCLSILRQAPHGAACAYKQMGRCAAPCDGSMSMDDYRALAERAQAFIAGDRSSQRDRLARQMAEAAGAMEFERAGALKTRLTRLDEFDSPRFAFIRDADRFRFVIIQPGPSFREARSFVCDRGAIAAGPPVVFPPEPSQVAEVLAACDRLAETRSDVVDTADRRRMGLVAWYLFSGKPGDGLLMRRDEVTADSLGEAIERAAEELKLRLPARRKKTVGEDAAEGAPSATESA